MHVCESKCSTRNKELVGRFLNIEYFYRLLITVQPKWILVSQMLKLVGNWPMVDVTTALNYYSKQKSALSNSYDAISCTDVSTLQDSASSKVSRLSLCLLC